MEHRRERLSSPNWEEGRKHRFSGGGRKDTEGVLGLVPSSGRLSSWSREQSGAGVGGDDPAFELAHRG